MRGEVERVSMKLGRRIRFVIGKPGLDGHSNGAEQIASRATDAGMDVVYDGIRFTPAEIVERARSGAHCIGLSILSGSHVALTEDVMAALRAAGLSSVPVIVGGIIPPADADRLREAGVTAVYTPKNFEINAMLGEIVGRGGTALRPREGSAPEVPPPRRLRFRDAPRKARMPDHDEQGHRRQIGDLQGDILPPQNARKHGASIRQLS